MKNMDIAKEGFRYYAFISYSHKDKKWARLVQKKLESYKLPNIIRKETGRTLPKRIAPVFRDEDELGLGILTENLRAELEASKFLIVICSPASARVNDDGKCWVDMEVAYFADKLGRANRIIPIIIEGSRNDALCATLKGLDCFALDASKASKSRIVNDIVAAILDLRPDDLWQREKRRRRRRWMGSLTAVGLFCVFLSLLGLFALDNYGEHKEYYVDYVNEWEVPEGIFPIAKEEALSRSRHYEFIYRGYRRNKDGRHRKLREVKYCNAAGLVADAPISCWGARPVRQEFIYDREDRLLKKVCKDRIGCVTSSAVFAYGQDTMFAKEPGYAFGENDLAQSEYRSGYINLIKGMLGDAYSFCKIFPEIRFRTEPECFSIQERDVLGLPSCIVYGAGNRQHSQRTDGYGSYGAKYQYDDMGRITSVRLLDENYLPLHGVGNFAGVDITYSSLTNTVVAVDCEGNATFSPSGWSIVKYSFFANGNLQSISCYDTEERLMAASSGAAIIEYEYDDSQRWIRQEKRYTAGKRLLRAEEGWAVREISVDADNGFSVDVRLLTSEGDEFVSDDGFSRVISEFYPTGCREKYYRGEDPVVNRRQAATVVEKWFNRKSDSNCEFVAVALEHDKKSTQRIAINGSFIEEVEYSPGKTFFVDGFTGKVKRIKATRKGVFGGAANSLLVELFNESDAKIIFPDTETDGILFKFNADGNISSITNVKDGCIAKSKSPDVSPVIEMEYDSNGYMSEIRFVDGKGLPFVKKDGVSVIRFDVSGRKVSVEFFGQDGKTPVAMQGRHHKMEMELDQYGNANWTRFYNSDGRLTEGPAQLGGCAVLHQESTPDGRPLLVECYDADNRLKRDQRSNCYIAKYEYSRDEEGRQICTECYYDIDGVTPMRSRDGIHMTKTVTVGNINEIQAVIGQGYNLSGARILSQSYWDVDRKSPVERAGVAFMEAQYDKNGIPNGMKAFDKNGNMVVCIIDMNGKAYVPVAQCRFHDDASNMDFAGIVVAIDGEYCLCDMDKIEELLADRKHGFKIDMALCNFLTGEFTLVVVDFTPGERVDIRSDAVPLEVFSRIRAKFFPMDTYSPLQREFNPLFSK